MISAFAWSFAKSFAFVFAATYLIGSVILMLR